MENLYPKRKIFFHQLSGLFSREAGGRWILDREVGEGSLEVYDLGKGLRAEFWNCSFNADLELHPTSSNESRYYTLAFFLNTRGFRFGKTEASVKGFLIWDTIFFSANGNHRMYVQKLQNIQCLSISVSKKWLTTNVFDRSEALKALSVRMSLAESFLLFESMDAPEKKLVHQLMHVSWIKKNFGTFYIKSCVLKMLSDFFYKIKEREVVTVNDADLDTSITKVEQFLCSQVTGSFPGLKHLEYSFSISPSTLKRHFKKKYGLNMSSYFTRKKMEYARQLIHEKNTDITETATLLGYRNVNYFITQYRKHQETYPFTEKQISQSADTGCNSSLDINFTVNYSDADDQSSKEGL